MDISWWWSVFLMTFDGNHDRECGKSLTMKASSIRNLFHQERRWMENSIVIFWGKWGKTSGTNVQTRCNNFWVLHNDNALAHVSLNVRQFVASMKMTVIPHPPYSLHLATCEFFLFPKMKLKFKGQCYDGTEEIQTAYQNMMKTLTQNAFQKCLRLWKSCWNRCINVKRDNFKDDGANRNFGKWFSYGRGISGTFG